MREEERERIPLESKGMTSLCMPPLELNKDIV